MSEKDRLIEKARKLGREYMSVYSGCAQTTLLAVADTLNMEVSEDLFKAMIGLSSLSGGCGGICARAALKEQAQQETKSASRISREGSAPR